MVYAEVAIEGIIQWGIILIIIIAIVSVIVKIIKR